MKRLLAIFGAVLMTAAVSTTSFAQVGDKEVDVQGVFSTGPNSLDSGFGVNFGGGYELKENIQGRVDIGYLSYSTNGVDLRRIPITVSGRYIIPVQDKLNAHAQAGLELSLDKAEISALNWDESTTEFGVTIGGGINYAINEKMGIVADARYHIIDGSYLTIQGGLAFKF